MRVWLPCVLLVAACSNLLGLSAPREQLDAGIDAAAGDAAPSGDFTVRVTTAKPRVPQNSFDFVDLAVTRSGTFTGPVDLAIPQPPLGVTVTPAIVDSGSDTGVLELAGNMSLSLGSDLMLDVVASGGGIEHHVTVDAIVVPQPGTLDPGFGSASTGVVRTEFAGSNDHSFFNGALANANGTLVAVGVSEGSPVRAVIARYTASGVLDTSFGATGSGFTLDTGDPTSTAFVQLYGVARQSTGNFVCVGQSPDGATQTSWTDVFDATGHIDKEFGDPFDVGHGEARAVATLANDSFFVVEDTNGSGTTLVERTSTGNPDTGFHGDGSPLPLPIAYAKNVGIGGAQALSLDATGTAAYVGGAGATAGEVVRVTPAGALDAAFGSNGIVDVGSGAASITALAVQHDGNLVIAGAPALVVRVLPTGMPDASFGSGGAASLGATSMQAIVGVAIAPDGRIVVAGNSGTGETIVVRLLPDGTLDASFGTAGVAFVGSFDLGGVVVALDGGVIGFGLDTSNEPLSAGLFRLTP